MNILRKAGTAVAATLLVFVLFSFGLAWSINKSVGSAGNIKKALKDSGIYQSVVGEVLDQTQKQQHKDTPSNGTNEIPVTKPEVRSIIEQAFPPEYLQSQAEGVIDASYAWLQGKTPTLQFKVDVSQAKQRLATGMEQYTQQHLSSLPQCTADTMPSSDVDPFTAACVPPGFDIPAAAAKTRDTILNGDFLKDTTITADSIKSNDGKTLSQQTKDAPHAYHKSVLGIYASGVLALGLATAVVFGSADWRRGMRRVGIIFVTIGALSALFGWLTSFTVHKVADKVATTQTMDKPLQMQLITIVQSITNSLRTWWMVYGVALIVLGIGLIVAAILLMRAKPEKGEHISLPPGGDDLVAEAPDTPKSMQTSEAAPKKARPRKVH